MNLWPLSRLTKIDRNLKRDLYLFMIILILETLTPLHLQAKRKSKLATLLGDILETSGHGEAQTEEGIYEAELQKCESEPGETLH